MQAEQKNKKGILLYLLNSKILNSNFIFLYYINYV